MFTTMVANANSLVAPSVEACRRFGGIAAAVVGGLGWDQTWIEPNLSYDII